MVEIVYEDQNGLDVRTNSVLHLDLEKSRAGEYSKCPYHYSESVQRFLPLEKREWVKQAFYTAGRGKDD
jgi:hypothetical protein